MYILQFIFCAYSNNYYSSPIPSNKRKLKSQDSEEDSMGRLADDLIYSQYGIIIYVVLVNS